MKIRYHLIFVFGLSLFFTACSTPKILGLWRVQKVKVGDQERTPYARWVKFNADASQSSGNGWAQHSIGTWQLNADDQTLRIVNTNGYLDPYEAFQLSFAQDYMYWKREEEGQPVEVILQKIEAIPAAPSDQLLGVWDLTKVLEDEEEKTSEYDPTQKRYLFIRPDKIVIRQHTPAGRRRGIYHTHSHRLEIEFIFNDAQDRQQWRYELEGEKLVLKAQRDGKAVRMEYQRINYFPT